MTDPTTIAVYDARVKDYAAQFSGPPSTSLVAFAAALPRAATVLDLGCGPGHAAGFLAAQGHAVHAWDASTQMVALAAAHPGVTARQASFDDLVESRRFHGIWANFSLLHAPRADFPRHLDAIARALKPGGRLHLGLKLGTGERTDHLGRFYAFHGEDELRTHLTTRGFTITDTRTGEEAGLAGTVEPYILIAAHG